MGRTLVCRGTTPLSLNQQEEVTLTLADETTTTFADLLLEMKGVLVENFPKYSVLLDELRRDTSRQNFSGSWVRIPLLLDPTQMASGLSETGTVNTPRAIDSTQAHVLMARNLVPVSFSPDVMYASKNDVTSFAEASKLRMQQAEIALGRLENEAIHTLGSGKLVQCTGTGSTSVITLTTTQFSSYQMYVNRVIDLGTTNTLETSGSGRKITAVSATDSSITLDAAVTFTASDFVLVSGSAGNAMQSLQQIYATTGTFENIGKSTVVGWQGVDGRGGDTTSADLSISILDGAERRVKQNGGLTDFYVGDPAVIDKFGQTLLTQSRWSGDKGQLDTGWAGIQYKDKLIIPDFDHRQAAVTGIHKDALQMYGYNQGPEWDDLDGAIFKRIGTRALPVEAWLVDYVQLGAKRCNTTSFLTFLNKAS